MSLHRDILLDINELGDTQNPFSISLKMMKGLREGKITNKQYENLSSQLKYECQKEGVSTKSEIGFDLF